MLKLATIEAFADELRAIAEEMEKVAIPYRFPRIHKVKKLLGRYKRSFKGKKYKRAHKKWKYKRPTSGVGMGSK